MRRGRNRGRMVASPGMDAGDHGISRSPPRSCSSGSRSSSAAAPADGSLFWLGGGALVAIVTLLLATTGVPGGWLAARAARALAVWLARLDLRGRVCRTARGTTRPRARLSRSSPASGSGSRAARARSRSGSPSLLGAGDRGRSLGKVLPPSTTTARPDVTRLRGPVGLWNQLALAARLRAAARALAQRGVAGRCSPTAALVALAPHLLARRARRPRCSSSPRGSRSPSDRVESATRSSPRRCRPRPSSGVAFALPGVTSDGAVVARRAGGTASSSAPCCSSVRSRRLPSTRAAAAARRAGSPARLVVAALVAVSPAGRGGVSSGRLARERLGSVGNGGQRARLERSSNFRFTWWHQAWRRLGTIIRSTATAPAPSTCTTCATADSYLDFTTEPHDLPLQFLSEPAWSVSSLLVARLRGSCCGRSCRRRGPRARARAASAGVPRCTRSSTSTGTSSPSPRRRSSPPARSPGAPRDCGGSAASRSCAAAGRRVAVVRRARCSPWLGAPLGRRRALVRLTGSRDHAREPRACGRPAPRRAALAKAIADDGDGSASQRAFALLRRRRSTGSRRTRRRGDGRRVRLASSAAPRLAYTYLEKYTELDQKANPERRRRRLQRQR